MLPAVIVGVAVVAFIVRGTSRLRDAALFAEDGQIFLAGAHNGGLGAIVEPYAGYLHVIPRLVSAVLDLAPLTAAPILYAAAAMTVHLGMLTPALSSRLGWLIPTPLLRAVLFALLCLMPPMWEAYGNIANLIFIGGICLLLLVLSTDPLTRVGRIAELAAVGLLGLSGPLIVIFLPLVAWRWWRNGRTSHSLTVGAVAVASAVIQLAVYLTSERSTPGGGSPGLLVRTAYQRVGGSWLVGDANVFVDNLHPALTVAAGVWLVLAAAVTVFALPRTAPVLWLMFAVLLGSAVNAYGQAMVASSLHFQRHIMIPLAIVIVLLVAVLGSATRSWAKAVAALCLLAGVGGIAHDLIPAAYPYRPDLAGLEECVDSGAAECSQSIFDGDWTVVLTR
ncbi:hypothetical protein O4215_18935 [Rhodococcus maanshanensis]|uniref:hypothetical protein n=1 Tax=Rhodococcus maanshanensis TaxID=183556 RepID=UPI0022B4E5A1|nr:hypothetical protein [Rhodococcus maanshanensis]MCZ4557642.1 hypothetical protein [Rhodococcus maanshanensis]